MGTSVFDSVLLQNSWSTPEMRRIFNDENRIQKWLDFESALALEQAKLNIIPQDAANEIAKKAHYDCLDMDYIMQEFIKTKHPLVPTIRGLEKACDGDFGEYVHFGVTTQDVIDTGLILQLKQAHEIIKKDVIAFSKELYRLSKEHKDTPMMGRTLALQALPITFGHKTAIWLSELHRHYNRLLEAEKRVFVGSIVGAVGTKASLGDDCDLLEKNVNNRLGLNTPNISWQPSRDRLFEYGSVLGGINATMNKIANQLLLMAHNELDELAEPFGEGQVGSSTMPHKRNPAVTENAATVSTALKANIMILSDITKHEHERDGSVWKTEWKIIPEICLMLSVVFANLQFTFKGLEVRKDKMRANLDILKGYVLAERVMFALCDAVGKQTAHELVYESSMQGINNNITFKKSLKNNKKITAILSDAEIDQLLDPTTYTGNAPQAVKRALNDINKSGWLT